MYEESTKRAWSDLNKMAFGGRIMALFAPRQLCQKLQEMGCKPEEELLHSYYPHEDEPHSKRWHSDEIDAFTQNDFTGNTPQARKNAELVWGLGHYHISSSKHWYVYDIENESGNKFMSHFMPKFQFHRHAMVDHEGPWWEYLQKTMRDLIKIDTNPASV